MKANKLDILSTGESIDKFFGTEPLIAASIRVTKGCNLRCPHCYANGGCVLKGELKTAEIKSLVDQLAKLGVLHIFYTGGEPFIRKDMAEILQYTDKKGLGILLSTNAQLVNKNLLKKLQNLNIKLFQVSIDGNGKTHDSIRGKGTWSKSQEVIKQARKILKKNIGVGTVMVKKNWEQLDQIMEQASINGADIFSLMLLIVSGRADEALNPTPKEYLRAINNLFVQYGKSQDKIKFANNTTIPSALVPKKWRQKGLHENFALCSFPYCLGVEANGDVAPCDGFFNFPEMILGNIREKSLKEIWEKSKILKEIRKINPSDLKGVCSKCVYRDYCAGGCRASAYNKYKDLTMPDPACQSIYEAGLFPEDCLR